MPKLEAIEDRDTLRQVAIHLEKSNLRLITENAKLRAENARLRGQDVSPQMELDLLKEQLAALERKVYGPSSEKRPSTTQSEPDSDRAPAKGHGPRSQPDLPLVEVSHTLPAGERKCSFCGGELVEMGDQAEESEEITVVEASYKLVKHRRQKYRCACNANVITAPGPAKLIPGGRYSVDFAAHVAEAKYLDHLPLERQVRAMERRGLYTDSQTLWDQVEALAGHLRATYEALVKQALAAEVVYADETFWRLMGTKDQTSRWWTWCVVSDDTAAYRMLGSRSADAARQILGDCQGVVMTDGYGAYEALARAGPGLTLAHCWAHVRRKFIEAEDAYPDLSRQAVELIGKLFAIEREVPRLLPGSTPEERERVLDLRRRLRDERSRRLVTELMTWAIEVRGGVLGRSKMGRAIDYMLKLWPGLTRFLDDPRVRLENNAAERALRGVVVGRKNHYGSRSKRGTEVAALFYSLFETAKLSGVDPRAYVIAAAKRAIATPGAVTLPADI